MKYLHSRDEIISHIKTRKCTVEEILTLLEASEDDRRDHHFKRDSGVEQAAS